MELTTTQLNYLLVCYSMVFSLAGLYFFVKAEQILKEVGKLLDEENLYKHEGTDAD